MSPEQAWFDGVVLGLIRHAARKAPPALSERLEEEWLADLEGRRGGPARLRFALGCSWATRVIAHQLAAPVGAAAASGGRTAMLLGPIPPMLSRRTTVAALIGVLHVLVILGLASGLAREVLPAPAPRLDVHFVARTAPPPPPLQSDPKFAPVRPEFPPPVWTGDKAEGAITVAPVDVSSPAQVTAAPAKRVARVTGGPGRGFPNTADYYPPPSIRLEEKGVASVRVCVDAAGRLSADPVIAQSSGSARLDAAALRLAKAGSGHYLPSTEDGRPVSACYPFGVRFELR